MSDDTLGKLVHAEPNDRFTLGIFKKFMTPARANACMQELLGDALGIDAVQYAAFTRALRITGALVVGDIPLNFLTRTKNRTSNNVEVVVPTLAIPVLHDWVTSSGFSRRSGLTGVGPFLYAGRHGGSTVTIHFGGGCPLDYVLRMSSSECSLLFAPYGFVT